MFSKYANCRLTLSLKYEGGGYFFVSIVFKFNVESWAGHSMR
jgi:hypothetical protein